MSSTLEFYLDALNVFVDASYAHIAGADDVSFNADVTATMDVDLATVKQLFTFHTDAIDITDELPEDISYKVRYTAIDLTDDTKHSLSDQWIAGTVCTEGDQIYSDGTSGAQEKAVPFEYVRYLAKKLFNTHLGVDLFSNEQDLRDDLHRSARSVLDARLTELNDLESDAFVTSDKVSLSLASGSITANHPSYVILQKIIKNHATRLADLATLLIDGTGSGTGSLAEFKMPFQIGDKLYFKLTIKAADDQESVTGIAANSINDRSYKIEMTVV